MSNAMRDIDERANLTNNNQFELLLFRLGAARASDDGTVQPDAPSMEDDAPQGELYGINVFKVREILVMPKLTTLAAAPPELLGMADIRGQVIPVIDLPRLVGCTPRTGLNILLVTEYARSTQGFAVESVDEIVRLAWKQVVSAETSVNNGLVTSLAKLDPDSDSPRLVQVLDVEQILRNVMPARQPDVDPETVGPQVALRPGTRVLAADDSALARGMVEQGLKAMGVPVTMTHTGKQAWDQLCEIADRATSQGKQVRDEIALVLTDLEMPEMDGFTLTRNIKADPRFHGIPVVIHSSLSGSASEDQVRRVGADAYVSKFLAKDLAETIRGALAKV